MTAVTTEAVSEQRVEPRPGTLARRLAALLVAIRASAGEGLEATVARSIDEAFASLHREMR
ncbi:MAG TPA: hypothetical protein VGG91_16710 [Myxococcaceae bacterium]